MNRLLILSLFLTGCSWPIETKLGDKVRVVSGFYEKCEGVVQDKMSWVTLCQDKSYVKFTNHCTDYSSGATISNCDLEVIGYVKEKL